MPQIGFLLFPDDLFKELLEITQTQNYTELELRDAIEGITQYSNQLLALPATSRQYQIQIIDYLTFLELYRSIHQDQNVKEPLFLVTGAINLKDPEIPGYVAFSIPKQFVLPGNGSFSCKDLIVNASHQRVERFLHMETILADVYRHARQDYHEQYTLDKQKNVEAFLLYYLNKELIPIQETTSYAMNSLIAEFIDRTFPFLDQLPIPLVEHPFNEEDLNVTQQFIEIQYQDAQVERVDSRTARTRLNAGLTVIKLVTRKFPILCEQFFENYPIIKSQYPTPVDLNHLIETTIRYTTKQLRLDNLRLLYDREFARLLSLSSHQ